MLFLSFRGLVRLQKEKMEAERQQRELGEIFSNTTVRSNPIPTSLQEIYVLIPLFRSQAKRMDRGV